MPDEFQAGEIESEQIFSHVIRFNFRPSSPPLPGQPARVSLNQMECSFLGRVGNVQSAVIRSALTDGYPQQESASPEFWIQVRDLLNELYPPPL